MRLGTCIAVEVLVGVATLGALGAGTAFGVAGLRDYLDESDRAAVARAEAAAVAHKPVDLVAPPPPEPEPVAVTAPEPPPPAEVAPPVPTGPVPAWNEGGMTDEQALAPLRDGKLVRVKFNAGGSSLSMRFDFDNRARAAFKPDQIHPQSQPRREIAAYRIDRLLGLNRVPPAIGRSFPYEEVVREAPASQRARLDTEAIAKNGVLRGELSWWIPKIANAEVAGYRIDSNDGVVTWKRWLKPGAVIPAGELEMVKQISDMTVFDFLIDNADRWSGNNTKCSPDGAILYYMDNTLSFSEDGKGQERNQRYLGRVKVFSRRLIERLRALTVEEVRAAVEHDVEPFKQLLTDREIAALMKRRRWILDWVQELVDKHGEEKVLAFP